VILCLCRAVSDRTVRLVVHAGAQSVADVADACGAGAGCGSCHEAIAGILEHEGGQRLCPGVCVGKSAALASVGDNR
jgi:bacterioferritin-associated ferredoxin